jgi:hypothetical protein
VRREFYERSDARSRQELETNELKKFEARDVRFATFLHEIEKRILALKTKMRRTKDFAQLASPEDPQVVE